MQAIFQPVLPALGAQIPHYLATPAIVVVLGSAGGTGTAMPIDNPYNVNDGYGNMFSYRTVFTPTGTT